MQRSVVVVAGGEQGLPCRQAMGGQWEQVKGPCSCQPLEKRSFCTQGAWLHGTMKRRKKGVSLAYRELGAGMWGQVSLPASHRGPPWREEQGVTPSCRELRRKPWWL